MSTNDFLNLFKPFNTVLSFFVLLTTSSHLSNYSFTYSMHLIELLYEFLQSGLKFITL